MTRAPGVAGVAGIPFTKGHGTQNDFILLPDLDSVLELTTGRVRALTDRHRGLGADGILRVVRTAACPEVAEQASQARWFMDYRNADGSTAEMCGNGARLFARYLLEHGLETKQQFAIATRGGLREVMVVEDVISVELGPAIPLSEQTRIEVKVGESSWEAAGVLFPNPHAVVFVDDLADAGSLLHAPRVSPEQSFPAGVNVEFVVVRGDDHVEFRVFERGVGETRSCGTGAVAVAWALRNRQGATHSAAPVVVDVRGGRLHAYERPDGHWVLAGPTELVVEGVIDVQWWKDNE